MCQMKILVSMQVTCSLHLTHLMRLVNYSLGLPFNVCLLKKVCKGFTHVKLVFELH
jgi:hypothetical protein